MRSSNIAVATKAKVRKRFSFWDFVAISFIFWILVLIMNGTEYMYSPVPLNLNKPVSLDPQNLPEYALRTTVRLFIGLASSIIFSIIYALLAAKVKRLERPLISLLDILQAVPVLGYISFTIAGFVALFPGNILGYELAVIFAIFTCQVWNITYSIYQSIITLPKDLEDVTKLCKLNAVQKFILIEFPYAIPPLIWNMMLSMSGAWFFVVASEAIIEGNQEYFLPGIGSYIAAAIHSQSLESIIYAIIVMALLIAIYDQIFFKPLIDWSEKFKYETQYIGVDNKSWCYRLFHKAHVARLLFAPFNWIYKKLLHLPTRGVARTRNKKRHAVFSSIIVADICWYGFMGGIALYAFYQIYLFSSTQLSWGDLSETLYLGLVSTIRIIIMMIITIIIWAPISIYIGMRPKIARVIQPLALMLASFPANLIFPVCVYYISKYALNHNIWLSFLLIFSMQWYLVFNIVAGVSSMPAEIKYAASNFKVKGVSWYRNILIPAILPDLLIGAITAWGSAWNATIIVEFAEWGSQELVATGLGAYITEATNNGQMAKIILGVAVMVAYVELFNRMLWRPIFKYADQMENLK